MFRTSAARVFCKPCPSHNASMSRLSTCAQSIKVRTSFTGHKKLSRSPTTRALALRNPPATCLVRYQTTRSIDRDQESKQLQQRLHPDPEHVSTDSTVRSVFHEKGEEDAEPEIEMSAGIKQDFKTIQDTFSLRDVPKEALYVGLAGVLPYLATSISTVYLAYDINYAWNYGEGLLLSGPTAEALLHLIEPIQLGYGASIIAFLGAIHWGLEWAGYGGHQGYRRYAIGVVATAVAWPTVVLSAEIGLIAQFLAFTMLYYTDARATTAGWCPPWYTTYRFVLTFIVGGSIVLSLIGRGEIADKVQKAPGPAERMKALREGQMEQLEREEAERRSRIVAEDEDEDAAETEDEEEESEE